MAQPPDWRQTMSENKSITDNINLILIKIILPFIFTNLIFGLVIALLLGSFNYIAHASIDRTWNFGIGPANGKITINQEMIGGILFSCLFAINQLFVILFMICLRKRISNYSPMLYVLIASIVTGCIIGLLMGISTPSGFGIHFSADGTPTAINCNIGESVPYQGALTVIGDILCRIVIGFILGLVLAVIYGITSLILGPINGLRNLAASLR